MYDQKFSNRDMGILENIGKFLKSNFLEKIDEILVEKCGKRYAYWCNLRLNSEEMSKEYKWYRFELKELLDSILRDSGPLQKLIKNEKKHFYDL